LAPVGTIRRLLCLLQGAALLDCTPVLSLRGGLLLPLLLLLPWQLWQ
jgi:hypothetical protein